MEIFTLERAQEIAATFSADRGDVAALKRLAAGEKADPLAVIAEADTIRHTFPQEGNWADGTNRGQLYYLRWFAYERMGELRAPFHRIVREDVTDALEAARLDQDRLIPEFEYPHFGLGFAVKVGHYEAMTFGAELAVATANRKAIEQKVGDAFDDSKAIRDRIRAAEPVYGSKQSRSAVLLFPLCILVDDANHATV